MPLFKQTALNLVFHKVKAPQKAISYSALEQLLMFVVCFIKLAKTGSAEVFSFSYLKNLYAHGACIMKNIAFVASL